MTSATRMHGFCRPELARTTLLIPAAFHRPGSPSESNSARECRYEGLFRPKLFCGAGTTMCPWVAKLILRDRIFSGQLQGWDAIRPSIRGQNTAATRGIGPGKQSQTSGDLGYSPSEARPILQIRFPEERAGIRKAMIEPIHRKHDDVARPSLEPPARIRCRLNIAGLAAQRHRSVTCPAVTAPLRAVLRRQPAPGEARWRRAEAAPASPSSRRHGPGRRAR